MLSASFGTISCQCRNYRKSFLLCALLAVCTNFFGAFSACFPTSSNAAFLRFLNNSYIDRGHSAGIGHVVLQWFWNCSLYAAPFGNFFGCLLAPVCNARYGTLNSILLANSYALVASLIASGAIVFDFPELLLLALFVAACAAPVGLISLVLFLQQLPTPDNRGRFSYICPCSISLVKCVTLLLNALWPGLGQNLLILMALSIPPQIVGILLILWMRRKPQFLLREEYIGPSQEGLFQNLFSQRHRRVALLHGFCGFLVGTSLLLICFFLSPMAGLLIVDKVNRRQLIIRTALISTISLVMFVPLEQLGRLLTGHLLAILSLPFLLLFIASLGSVLSPISYFLAAELLPMPCALSATVLALLYMLNIMITFFYSWITPLLMHHIDTWAFLPLFVLPPLICLMPMHSLLPETRARSKDDIVSEIGTK